MSDDRECDRKHQQEILAYPLLSEKTLETEPEDPIAGESREVARLKNIVVDSMARIAELEKIGRVFHDFNNILSSSMGYASLASERATDVADEKLSRYLSNIEKAGVRSRDLVRECLAQRQRFRDGQRCSLEVALDSVFAGRAQLETENSANWKNCPRGLALNMTIDSAELLFLALAQFASPSQELHLCGEVHEDPHCSGCGSELRGLQLEFIIKKDHTTSTSESFSAKERRLVTSLADVCGGHFCESLVQDHEIVVYLKANASQVD